MPLPLGLLLLGLAGAGAASGCGPSPTEPSPEWLDAFEDVWQSVKSCWQGKGYDTSRVEHPKVKVRSDCRSKYPEQDFLDGKIGDQEIWLHGDYDNDQVTVCPDLKGLPHEMSHHISKYVRGNTGQNGEGICGL